MKQKLKRLMVAWMVMICCTLSASALPMSLIPGGCTVGVKLYTEGLMVTGFEIGSAAKAAGLKKGDVIVAADGKAIHTTEALRECLGEDRVLLTVLRNGKRASFCVTPREDTIGAYVKDSVAGIGTVTYYDPNTGAFGALGHGVCGTDAEHIMPMMAGVVVPSNVTEVRKGSGGDPGELKGTFDVEHIWGEVTRNTERGIFGSLSVPLNGKPLPVGRASEVKQGAATIMSNVNGREIRSYEVEILKVFSDDRASDRNLLLRIKDEELLNQTGGIVQGMSGSPIIQDGRLVGAVTHVLVNDPTRGYGIFIENMLDAAG